MQTVKVRIATGPKPLGIGVVIQNRERGISVQHNGNLNVGRLFPRSLVDVDVLRHFLNGWIQFLRVSTASHIHTQFGATAWLLGRVRHSNHLAVIFDGRFDLSRGGCIPAWHRVVLHRFGKTAGYKCRDGFRMRLDQFRDVGIVRRFDDTDSVLGVLVFHDDLVGVLK